MDNWETLTFRIDSLTPDSLPMARLAEYLKELSSLYGSHEHVHFEQIEKGSVKVKVRIDQQATEKVRHQLVLVDKGTATKEPIKAYQALDRLLRADNAIAEIYGKDGGNVLIFPGRTKPTEDPITVVQQTSVDGVVIKIGGKDETIPVLLKDQEGNVLRCQIWGSDQAKKLAKHYLDAPVRVHGTGRWTRNEDGWSLDHLTIQSWEVLDTRPASEVLSELGQVEKNGWARLDKPMDEWKKMRGID